MWLLDHPHLHLQRELAALPPDTTPLAVGVRRLVDRMLDEITRLWIGYLGIGYLGVGYLGAG